ncbi:MAG: hypothetical protein KBA30_03270 [Clostridia bacterium]|nr:hypothetical protein [Clostridia bacterium]
MDEIIRWLMDGDASIRYLTTLRLLDAPPDRLRALQDRIPEEGYGRAFLDARGGTGHWGLWFYQPKWTCTHYTLTDMKALGMPPDTPACREMVARTFDECMLPDGGVNLAKSLVQSDVAIDGMILDYASYFCPDDPRIGRLADYVLDRAKPDGGWSWDANRPQGDPHTTICVLEGLVSCDRAGFTGHVEPIPAAVDRAVEWLLSRSLLLDGEERFRKLSYPYRYRYDVLRELELLALAGVPYDSRMEPALRWLEGKADASGRWRLENVHPGALHFPLEERRSPSRFITLKALTVLRAYRESRTLADVSNPSG